MEEIPILNALQLNRAVDQVLQHVMDFKQSMELKLESSPNCKYICNYVFNIIMGKTFNMIGDVRWITKCVDFPTIEHKHEINKILKKFRGSIEYDIKTIKKIEDEFDSVYESEVESDSSSDSDEKEDEVKTIEN
ncbi:MAG: hypothetical protein Q8910_02810 [Bacteroidota bacterium]|nr:hypothetical protein [Bacteroidota bacterium]